MSKKKLLKATVSSLIFCSTFVFLSGGALATRAQNQGEETGSTTVATDPDTTVTSTQTSNSATDNEIQTETQNRLNNPETGTMTEAQIQEQIKENQPEYSPTNVQAQSYKKQVASSAEKLINLSYEINNASAASEIRLFAKNQSASIDLINQSIDNVVQRANWAQFLIGPNFGELNNAKENLEQNRLRIRELTTLMNQAETDSLKLQIANEIINLNETDQDISDKIDQLENNFSLLGWLIELFY